MIGLAFAVALLWLSLASWMPVLAAIVVWRQTGRWAWSSAPAEPTTFRGTLAVLIPAHQGGAALPATLFSVRAALAKAGLLAQSQVVVGLNGWDGDDARKAAAGADRVLSFPSPSKWRTLKALVEATEADWIACVDAGTLWPEDLLLRLAPNLKDPSVAAVNPRYSDPGAGPLQRLYWWIEASWKRFENRAGGPVSFHGATMFFRGSALRRAFAALEGDDWLNDDVVLPLLIRIGDPEKRTFYAFDAVVVESESSAGRPELARRRRLLAGNIQWLKAWYGASFSSNIAVGLVATRRAARVAWAWPLLGMAVALAFWLQPLALAALLFLAIAALGLSASARRAGEAFWVSLSLPWAGGALRRWK